MSKHRMNDMGGALEQSATGMAIGAKIGSLAFVGALAALIAMALTPPKSRTELMGMIAASFGSAMFIGPLAIEYYGLSHLSFQSQLGICFMVAAPAWLGWCVVARQFDRWRKAKNPEHTIREDLKR